MATVFDLLRHLEGDKLYLYDDATGKRVVPGYVMIGHPTIGTGFALDVGGLTQDEDDLLLAHRAARAESACASIFGSTLQTAEPARFAALASMAYQMGVGGLEGFIQLRGAVERGDWQAARDAALDSAWAHQTPGRAQEVAAMLLTGEWPI